jgi:hypothetical protein
MKDHESAMLLSTCRPVECPVGGHLPTDPKINSPVTVILLQFLLSTFFSIKHCYGFHITKNLCPSFYLTAPSQMHWLHNIHNYDDYERMNSEGHESNYSHIHLWFI